MLPRESLLVWPMMMLMVTAATVLGVDDTFRNEKQELFVKSLKSYDVISPVKVTFEGNFASHELGHRVRRDVQSSNVAASGESQSVHYHWRLNNEDVYIRLQPNHRWISPGLVVEKWNSSGSKISYGKLLPKSIKQMDNWHCFFKGSIVNWTNSHVALSTCDGLLGYLNVNQERYIIEPLKKPAEGNHLPHPHIIYKRSDHLTFQHENQQQHQTCGITDGGNYRVEISEREVKEKSRTKKHRKKFRRKKRSVSSERFVETLVVADKMMVDYYSNDDIETYILTIFNMISELYRDATIGNAVNIALVRIILLEDEDQENELTVNHHADHSLKSFCKWQKQINPKEESHPNHHDVAILITRYNICTRMNEPCSTLGLSEVAGMCQPSRSCNINEDSGLALAYTIAHEIGHNFGMNHDGPHNGCEPPFGERQHVMSPHLNADTAPLAWSNCSRKDITKFFDHDWGSCLDDEPSPHDFVFPEVPPGVMYDVNHQCWLQYGPNATYCHEIEQDVCTTLWCRQENKCVTRLEPAAPGTHCGPNKWCFNGHCIEMGEKKESINGGWGEWSEFTSCSRTCGAGVAKSDRLCDSPAPQNGGLYCIGERRKYKLCNTMPCQEHSPSFRAVQCSNFNDTLYKGKYHQWIPVSIKVTPCQLHCKPDGEFFSVMLAEMVEDGTTCNPGTRDMCINGKCRRVACDWNIDSEAQEDRCGICHGDGTQCQTIRGEFTQKDGIGYVKVVTIPAGARNIRLEEVKEAANYISIKDANGKYRLNGNWLIQWSGDYDFPGTIMYYRREGELETLHAPGQLKEDMQILLLYQGSNPGLKYEYTIPRGGAIRKPEFYWEYSEWSICTVTCGGGIQTSVAKCLEIEAGLVEDSYCNQTKKPFNMSRACNLHSCPSRWWFGPWQHCSVSCGTNGTRRRTVICVRPVGDDEQIALPDRECSTLEKPTELEPCHHKLPCPEEVFWKVGNWSDTCKGDPCSFQIRMVTCSNSEFCQLSNKPQEKKQCGDIICGSWNAGNWSECSKTCDEGVQFRRVYCEGGLKCHDKSEPISVRSCSSTCINLKESDLIHGLTKYDQESSGEGSNFTLYNESEKGDQNMDISLDEKFNSIEEEIVMEESNITREQKYNESQNKIDDHGDISDYLLKHNKSKYSKDGRKIPNRGHEVAIDKIDPIKAKGVTIKLHKTEDDTFNSGIKNNEVEDEEYNVEITTKKPFLEVLPQFKWVSKPWSICSMICSGGIKSREVLCYETTTETLVDNELCNEHFKPNETEMCNEEPCLEWQLTDWSECSQSCGEGVKLREVICPKENACNPHTRPKTNLQCKIRSCLKWVAGPWSLCTATCGNGTQTRHVKCIQPDTQLPIHGCDFNEKPSHRQNCNPQECPVRSAKFSSCIDKLETSLCLSLRHMCGTWYFKVKCCHTCSKQKSALKKAGTSSKQPKCIKCMENSSLPVYGSLRSSLITLVDNEAKYKRKKLLKQGIPVES